jgi:hypothetical protein
MKVNEGKKKLMSLWYYPFIVVVVILLFGIFIVENIQGIFGSHSTVLAGNGNVSVNFIRKYL